MILLFIQHTLVHLLQSLKTWFLNGWNRNACFSRVCGWLGKLNKSIVIYLIASITDLVAVWKVNTCKKRVGSRKPTTIWRNKLKQLMPWWMQNNLSNFDQLACSEFWGVFWILFFFNEDWQQYKFELSILAAHRHLLMWLGNELGKEFAIIWLFTNKASWASFCLLFL